MKDQFPHSDNISQHLVDHDQNISLEMLLKLCEELTLKVEIQEKEIKENKIELNRFRNRLSIIETSIKLRDAKIS